MIRYIVLDAENVILGEGSCIDADLHLKGYDDQAVIIIDQDLEVIRGKRYIDGQIVDALPDSAKVLSKLRRQRFELLIECDWTQLDDVSPEIKDKWKEYRQALRDLPEQYQEATSFEDIIWPTQPGK